MLVWNTDFQALAQTTDSEYVVEHVDTQQSLIIGVQEGRSGIIPRLLLLETQVGKELPNLRKVGKKDEEMRHHSQVGM